MVRAVIYGLLTGAVIMSVLVVMDAAPSEPGPALVQTGVAAGAAGMDAR